MKIYWKNPGLVPVVMALGLVGVIDIGYATEDYTFDKNTILNYQGADGVYRLGISEGNPEYNFNENTVIGLGTSEGHVAVTVQWSPDKLSSPLTQELKEIRFYADNSALTLSNNSDEEVEVKVEKLVVDTGYKTPQTPWVRIDGSKRDVNTYLIVKDVNIKTGNHLLLSPSRSNSYKFTNLKLEKDSIFSVRVDTIEEDQLTITKLSLDNSSISSWGVDITEHWGKKPYLRLEEASLMGKNRSDIPLKNTGVFTAEGELGLYLLEKEAGHSATIINAGDMYIGKNRSRATSSRTINEYNTFKLPTYIGEAGSKLHFGVDLKEGGNHDQLIIAEKASGKSDVIVHQVGGDEGLIENGLVLVRFEGDRADNELELNLKKPVTDGLYNYSLVQEDSNWALTNSLNPELDPENPEIGGENSNSGGNAGGIVKDYATQSSAYLATQVVSNDLFKLRYHDRLYVPNSDGLWTSVTGSLGKFKSTLTDGISAKTNRVTMFIGKDLVSTDEYAVGLMASYGYASGKAENNNARSTAEKTDYRSHGFAVGIYGTYTFASHSYVDAWVQYVHTRNKLEWGDNSEKYNAKGAVLSVEAAYAFSIADSIYFQSQGQVTYMGVKADDLKVHNHTYSSDRGNVQLRLGGRFFGENVFANGQGAPYVEANYIHNTKAYKMTAKSRSESVDLELDGVKNLFQLKVGSDFNLSNNSKIGAYVSHTFGKKSYRDTQLNVDFRYNF